MGGGQSRAPRSDASLLRAHSRGSFARLLVESEASIGKYSLSHWFRFVQIIVLALRLITPLSYVVLICMLVLPSATPEWFGGLHIYCAVLLFSISEALFFPYYLWKFIRMNDTPREWSHFAKCKNSRLNFFHQCMDAMLDAVSPNSAIADKPELYLRSAVEGWFFETPLEDIYFENFQEWVACYFFNEDLRALSKEDLNETKMITKKVEDRLRRKFTAGRNKAVLSARLHLDPLFATQRPFLFYAGIFCLNQAAHLILKFLGYKKLSKFSSKAQMIYLRRADPLVTVDRSQNNSSTQTGKKRIPIVFIHGLGVGFAHYARLINHFPKDVDVYLLEWPHVAMQLATHVPSIDETKRFLAGALEADGYTQACFVAHSLGNTAISWMLRDERYAHFVASSVQMDPVTYLLCDPTVATVFLYKSPSNVLDLGMHYFVSRELYIAHALQRNFSWSYNICFAEDLLPVAHSNELTNDTKISNSANRNDHAIRSTVCQEIRHTIILSSHDSIVPVGPVSRYLDVKKQKFQKEGNDCFETLMFHGHHAEMMLYNAWLKIIGNRIKERYEISV